ncbi:hypothetical protein BGCPKDLD_4836 [Methylorubrum suomiense]|uniref:Uncharacterized protein n=1 Tax=Methylorubrum suomiense TaxID=144191 RepID=A0ABQ4V2B1_9HYPH|nr:hypothetical protein BGCPKDLD_4836 [Methylorubrum suomiense]
MAIQAFLQTVVRNAAVEMVDVVQAGIAGEPLQDVRQNVVRTAAQLRAVEVPGVGLLPDGLLVLVAGRRLTANHQILDAGGAKRLMPLVVQRRLGAFRPSIAVGR